MGRFRRVAEAFEMAARKVLDCDSSGSEHSPETMLDLSHLVNSFIENNNGAIDRDIDSKVNNESSSDVTDDDDDIKEMKESLKKLFRYGNNDLKRNVVLKVEKVWLGIKDNSLLGSKRHLMARLRDQGLDVGLCKSKWEKKGKLLSGDYEYIDVNVDGTRYIINVSLREEFEIARPTASYSSLLKVLPHISVSKVEEFKEIIKIMCKAVKKSMNQMKMTVPPWRRREYVQARWFGSYKRTTNEFPTKNTVDLNIINKTTTTGFLSIPSTCYGRYTENIGKKDFAFKMGNLAIAMIGAG
uniref:uncharacterized protein LOC122596945 n=1 Tax=Erigeron canadensis TaxID=72917 RepID=UPI001CB96F45|nr:uncharacterized protein LOC122596945 [Erigeron canadensis]